MPKRSAEASIKGYNYQFIHSIIDILEQSNDDSLITIEGIEDLDIRKSDFKELYQYKYHEFEKYRNSLVSKPIGLMFNHYLKDSNASIKYKLLIYLNEELPNLTVDVLTKILKLKTATDYVDDDLVGDCTNMNKIEAFYKKFSWCKAQQYEKIEERAVEILANTFSVTKEEALIVFLPNAIRDINQLGIKKKLEERTVTPQEFKNSLKRKKEINDFAYIHRIYGEKRTVADLRRRLKVLNVSKNNTDMIVYIPNLDRANLSNLVVGLIKKYFYDGNKNDFRPVTIITENSKSLKKNIFDLVNRDNEVLIMNDGYEDYCFNVNIFNRNTITSNRPLNGKVNEVNYNFKLISTETYLQNMDNIYFSNPMLVCIGKEYPDFVNKFSRVIMLEMLSNDSILSIIGG